MCNRRVGTFMAGFALLLVACCSMSSQNAHRVMASGVTTTQSVSLQAHGQTGPGQPATALGGSEASIVEFSLGMGVLFTAIALIGLRGYRRQPGSYYVHPFRGR